MFLNIILNNISQYYFYYCIFDQINAVLVSRRDFQKHDKIKHLNSMYSHLLNVYTKVAKLLSLLQGTLTYDSFK